MRPHIQGVEKEYGVDPAYFMHEGFSGGQRLFFSFAPIYYIQRVHESGDPFDFWLTNMGRLYMDRGFHPEYASPECQSSLDLVTWQRAGDEIMIDIAEAVNRSLWNMIGGCDSAKSNADLLLRVRQNAERQHLSPLWIERVSEEFDAAYRAFSSHLFKQVCLNAERRHLAFGADLIRVYRNSIDIATRSTYGEHENHLVRRSFMQDDSMRNSLYAILLLHLISRVIWQGSGLLHWEEKIGIWRYRLSQREFRTEGLIAGGGAPDAPGAMKPLITTRDEPLSEANAWFRLHIVGGDANMAEIVNRLKFGTTALLIQMFEDGFFGRRALECDYDTLRMAYRVYSCDATLRKTHRILGHNYSALDIQRKLFELAQSYAKNMKSSLPDDYVWTLEWWERLLVHAAADRPHEALMSYTDVSAKYMLIERDMEKYGYSWISPPDRTLTIRRKNGKEAEVSVGARLLYWELEYHRLSRTEGLFQRLPLERIVSPDMLAFAKENPPLDTRAAARRACCELLKRKGGIDRIDWSVVYSRRDAKNSRKVQCALLDPFQTHIADDQFEEF